MAAWRWTASGTASTCASRRSRRPPRSTATRPSPQAGGMAGYEQLCGVTGTVRAGGREREIRCLGQRGHGWGEPDWSRIESARTLAAWPDAGYGAGAGERAPAAARDHADELVWAALLDEQGTLRVEDPRAVDDLRRRGPPAPRRARAVARRRRATRTAASGEVAVRLDARPRRAAARLRVLPLADRRRERRGPLRRAAARGRGERAAPASSRSRAGPSSRARGTRPRAPRSAPATATAGRTPAPAPRRRPR